MTKEQEYQMIWDCFMSEQMTASQLDQHIREDSNFEEFVWTKIREIRNAVSEDINE